VSAPHHRAPRRLARPYTMVGGRTIPAGQDPPLESQVVRTPHGERKLPSCQFERREILLLCSEPVSVAELAGRLRVPVGVARILVSDLAADGLVNIDITSGAGQPDVVLLERVLHGLRAI